MSHSERMTNEEIYEFGIKIIVNQSKKEAYEFQNVSTNSGKLYNVTRKVLEIGFRFDTFTV